MTGVYTIPAVASTLPNENIRTPLRTVADHLEKTRSILDLPTLNDESSETDSESTERANFTKCTENKFHRDLNNSILCLTDLIPTLEEGLREVDLAGRIQEDQADAIIFHVTEAAKQFVLQVHDKFRKADTGLIERLGEANWQRFTRIRQQIHSQQVHALNKEDGHKNEDGKGNEEESTQNEERREAKHGPDKPPSVPIARFLASASVDIPLEQDIVKSVFRPISEFHDSGLGSSKPARSRVSASLASHTSFQSSVSEKNKGRLRVPPTPAEVSSGKPFTCFICGQILMMIKNRIEWK
jgi:hypothetical protein